jgi:Flp pilus assembly protein TadG
VEFALVLPIFLLILCGIMDFGFLLYSRMTVINAAREGARVATTMTEDAGQIPGVVQSQVSATANGLAVNTAVCRVPKGGGGCGGFGGAEAGDSVRVTVGYTHRAFFPLLFGTSVPMSSTVQMVLE